MKVKLLIIVGFVVVFAAGAVLGLASHGMMPRPPHHPDGAPPDRGGWLQRELNLSPDQAEKVREIWASLAGNREKYMQLRQQINHNRDEKIRELLSDEQRAKMDQFNKDADKAIADLEIQREKEFKDAVAKTDAILNPDQRKKYDEMIARQREHGDRGRFHRGLGQGPTTRPDSSSSRPL